MKWQPPIPKGAFVEARALGPGLALLGYCYDIVRAGGLIEISLHELCSILDTSYASIRRWWGAMQKMGIIERVEDRGRKGTRAYFNSAWIDWRQIEMRSEISSNMSTLPEISSPVSANNGEMRSEISSEISSNMSTNPNAYKVLMSSDQAGSEDRDRTARTLSHPAIAAYRKAFPDVPLNQKQAAVISALVGERAERLECWQEVIQDYELSPHWKPENIGNLRSRFEKKLLARVDTKAAPERPPLPVVQPNPNAVDAAASRRALSEEVKQLRRGQS